MIVNVGKVIIMVASARRSKESVVPAEDQLSSVIVIALSVHYSPKIPKLQMALTYYGEVVKKISTLSAVKVVGHATYYLKLLSFQEMVPQTVSTTPK